MRLTNRAMLQIAVDLRAGDRQAASGRRRGSSSTAEATSARIIEETSRPANRPAWLRRIASLGHSA